MTTPQTVTPATDNYAWVESTGLPGSRLSVGQGMAVGTINSHHAGYKIRVHKTEVEELTRSGRFKLCNPQPVNQGGVMLPP